MVIEESDFRLTPIKEGVKAFDLEILVTVRPKGKPERQEFQNAGYAMSIESALDRVINHRISNKLDSTSMKEYLRLYREERSKINELLKL